MTPQTAALAVQLPGFAGTALPEEYAGLLAAGLGGICLFGSNTADGPDATTRLVGAIHDAGPGSVVAIDEEGGDVTRLHAVEGSPVLGAAALGALDDLELTERTGAAVGDELRRHGIDLCLAPVADLNTNAANPVIGTRSFGTDPHRAAAHVAAWVRGVQAAGVAACVKHYPGHGDTADDSHLALPVVEVDGATLNERELVPFAAAVAAGCRSVMTSHIVVPAIDPERPATFSPSLLALLRERLGFDGAVVSDALDMAGASGPTRGIPEAAVLALAAGVDLLCLGPETDPALVEGVREAILRAVTDGRLTEERLLEAAARAATVGRHAPAETLERPDPARAALTVEGQLPDLHGAVLARVDSTPSIAVGAVPWGLPTDLAVDPDDPRAAERLRSTGGPLVVQVRDAHRSPATVALLRELEPVAALVVEWGWPGPAASATPRVCTHGTSQPAYRAVRELLG